MARYNYEEMSWDTVKVSGKECLFCDMRIDRTTIPQGKIMYEVADADSNGEPCRIRPGIMVNFFGTLLCDEPFEPDEGDTIWLAEGDWDWCW